MKHFFNFCICVFIAGTIMAQSIERQVIGIGSGVDSNTELYLEWSMGESFVDLHSTNFGLVTEGFIQPEVFDQKYFVSADLKSLAHKDGFFVEIYPNPVNDVLTLKLTEAVPASCYTRVLDMTGKVLLSKLFPFGSFEQEINMNSFDSGFYIIQLFSSEGELLNSKKVVKIRLSH